MSAATVAEIRQRVATAALAALGSDWRQCVDLPSEITRQGAGGDGLLLSVEVPSTTGLQPLATRASHPTAPWQAITRVVVRLAVRVRLDEALDSYDEGLGHERTAMSGIGSVDWDGTGGPRLIDWQRLPAADGTWMIHALSMDVSHPYGV